MKQVTLEVPDKKLPFFMELLRNLGLESKVTVTEGSEKKARNG